MSDVYFEERICTNCKEKNNCAIPMGILIKDYMKDRKCKKCGCLLEVKK